MKRRWFEEILPRALEASKVLAGLESVYESNLDTLSISTSISFDTIRSSVYMRGWLSLGGNFSLGLVSS